MATLKQIAPGDITLDNNVVPWSGTGYNIVSGQNLTFTMIQNDPNNGRPFSNLFSSFKLPYISGLSGATWPFQGAAAPFSALNQYQVLVIQIAKDTYGELIDGRTINLVIPTGQTDGTTTSIPSGITITSSYIGAGVQPTLPYDNSVYAAHFGHPQYGGVNFTPGESPGTNIAFLFCDNIKPPQSPGAGQTTWTAGTPISDWAYDAGTTPSQAPAGYNGGNPDYYQLDQSWSLATPKALASVVEDTPVGIAYLDKGFCVITDQRLIDTLLLSGMTSYIFSGDTGNYGNTGSIFGFTGNKSNVTEGAYTASTSARCEFYSFEKEWLLQVNAVASQNEFFTTENFSAAPTGDGGAGGSAVQGQQGVYCLDCQANTQNYSAFITEVGLYDSMENLIAIAKPDRPVEKAKMTDQTFTLRFKF